MGTLLSTHPSESSYALDIPAGFVTLKWGIDVPKKGTGTFYLIEGDLILTITLRDIHWNGSNVTMQGRIIRGAGSTIPMGIWANVSESGEIRGKIVFGTTLTPGEEPAKPMLTFTGKRREPSRTSAGALQR